MVQVFFIFSYHFSSSFVNLQINIDQKAIVSVDNYVPYIWDYFKGKTPFFRINTLMVSSIFITEPHYVRNFLVLREKNGNFENNLVVRLI